MLPDTTLDGNVDGSHTNHFSHYEVIVKQTKGTFNGTGFDNCVARIRRDGTITTTEHFFTGPVLYLEVEIYIVDIGGGSEMLTTTVAVGFDFK